MIEPMSCCFKKSDLLLAVVAAAAGFYFFSSLAVLWPLADIDLHIEPSNLIAASRSFLESRGFDLTGYKARSRLTVNEDALDFLEIVWGLERTRQEIKKGLPVFHHTVFFKRYGSPETFQVTVYPGVGVIGFYRNVRKDDPGGTITRDAARARARLCLEQLPGPKNAPLRETGYEKHGRPDRTDYTFTFEHLVAKHPRVALNTTVTVTGLSVTAVERTLDIPSDILEKKRRKRAREEFLIASGVAVAAAATVLVFLLFLRYLRQGGIRLGKAGRCVAVIFVLSCLTVLLQTAYMFMAWDPLWPWWIFIFRHVVFNSVGELLPLLLILLFIAAGDALDREEGWGRGESLWLLLSGKFFAPSVAIASGRGFLVGLICGGVMAGGMAVLRMTVPVRVSLQPLGFFFYAINSAVPSLSTLFFFLKIAFIEELGYRFFGGTWLLSKTSHKWLAVLAPAVLYGLLHTSMRFLPPEEPFWGRAAVLALVGCVWGWAFFKYDALTVVLSHFTADLFIFNWPRLASGRPDLVTAAVLTIMVPLIPAFLGGGVWLFRRAKHNR